MSQHRSQLRSWQIDQRWPHQIALRDEDATGALYLAQLAFCREQGLELAPQGHSVFHDGTPWRVRCFATREQAEKFQARFGGEWFDPRERGKGRHWMQWYRGRAAGSGH